MNEFENLALEFAHGVAAQTDAIRIGDHKSGDKHAKRYIKAFQRLRAYGDGGRNALIPLLGHSRSDVRVMAAAFLLRHRTLDARAILEQEAQGQGLSAFSAQETLKRWDEGSWALDPD